MSVDRGARQYAPGGRIRAALGHPLWEIIVVALSAPWLLFPSFRREWTIAALVVLLLTWLVRWVVVGRPATPTPLNAALLPLAISVVVAVWASALPELTLPKLTGIILGFATFRAIVDGVRTPRHLAWAVGIFLLFGLGVTALGIVSTNWMNKLPALQPLLASLPRLVNGLPGAETGIHANELAGTLLFFLPVALAACALPVTGPAWRRWTARFLAVLVVFFFGATLFLTQSRSAWIGAAAGVTAMAWLRWPRARGLLVAGALALLLVLLYVGPQQVVALIFPTEGTQDIGTMASTVSLKGRVELWNRALYAIRDFPLTGCGLGTFRRVVHIVYPLFFASADTDIAHAHNVFLQVALDLGLPGLVAYLALVGTSLWICWQTIRFAGTRRAWLALSLIGSLVAFHVYGIADTVALGAKPGVAFWLVIALCAALYRISRRAPQHPLQGAKPPDLEDIKR